MASGNRASMREGPLAQLFRKTEEKESGAQPAEPKAGKPLPEGGPAPQATRQTPEPQAIVRALRPTTSSAARPRRIPSAAA